MTEVEGAHLHIVPDESAMAPPVQLRVLVTGLRVKEALSYYLQLQVRGK